MGVVKTEKEIMEIQGFCQKDNCHAAISRGCLHSMDYCSYRQSCLIHYMERERHKSSRKEYIKKYGEEKNW
jgi:hypothetical protein